MRVVIAGGGLAVLTAALRAAELGARVTLLEKGDRPGGSFVYSSGYIWSYVDLPTFRREAPGGDSVLQRLILEHLGSCLTWLEGEGGRLHSRETGNPLTFGARFDPEKTASALVERLDASGGELLTDTAFEALLDDDAGRVTGVLVRSAGGLRDYDAGAVILASGGFAGDPELVGRHIVGGPEGCGCGRTRGVRGTVFGRRCGRARLQAQAWTNSTGAIYLLPRRSLLRNNSSKYLNSTVATPWRSTAVENATPTKAQTGPRRP